MPYKEIVPVEMSARSEISKCKPCSGFTIIELMLTIALIAVVAGIAVPSFDSFFERNRLATSINSFASALAVARSEAIKRKQTVTVCSSSNGTDCSDQSRYEIGWIVQVQPGNEVLWVNESLPDGYTLRGNGNVASRISYRSNGRPINFGSITLCRNAQADKARKLVINNTGRVRLDTENINCG